MNNLDYVKLAVSKDEARYNLNAVYRDKNHFVATDGHRLHLSNGLPDATPCYLDGQDRGQYPDYKQVFPNGDSIGNIFRPSSYFGKAEKIQLSKLKALDSFIGKHEKAAMIKLTLKSGEYAKIIYNQDQMTIEYILDCFGYMGMDIEIGLRLSYLLDAISFISNNMSCKISIFGQLTPILIQSCDSNGEPAELSAIVMPMRIL